MASKKEIDNQKELNALQRLTMSYMKDMEKSAADLTNSTDKRNKSLEKELSITQKNLKELQKTGDINKLIARINTQIGQASNKNFGVNEKNRNAYLAQLDAIKGISEGQKNAAIAAQGVFDVTDELASKFNGILDSIDGFIKKIPIIGPALSNAFKPLKEKGELAIKRATDGMKNGFIRQLSRAKQEGMSFTQSLSSGLKGGMAGAEKAIAGTLGVGVSTLRAMAVAAAGVAIVIGAVVIAVKLLVGAFKLGLERFKELDSAAKSFREQTGLLVSQTRGMQENIRAVNVEFANLGVGVEDVAHAAAEFVNEFGGIEQPSKEVLGSMVMLNKNFGVGINEAAKLNKVFQNIGDLSAEQSQYLIGQTTEMAKMAGVAPSKVIQDMADSSEYAYKYFQGSPQELAKAAVQAAKLGTSIAEAGAAADNLLDFQNSISSELEAQAMLGVNLNFGQARYLAANGDILGSQQAILDQIQKNVDLTNLNVYEQQALAKAAGMPIESIKNQIRLRERFGPLAKEELAAATALMDAGKDLNKITKEDLALQSQRMKSQQDMQSTMDAIQNEAGALKTGFMDMLAPLAGFVMNNLLDGLKMVGMILNPIMKGIGAIARVVFGIFGAIFDVITAIVSPIVAIGGAIIDMLVTPFQALASNLQPLFDKFKELKEATMKAVQPILDVFRSLGNMFGEMVGSGPIGMFIDFLTWGLGKIVSLIGFIAKGIGFVLKPIMVLISGLMQGISFIGKMINDYIIQPALAAGQMVGNSLSSIGTKLLDGFKTIGPSLLNFFGDVVKGWFKIITFVPRKLYEGFVNIFPQIGQFFSNIGTRILDGIRQVGPNLLNLFTNVVKGWFNIITFIPTKLYEAFVGIFPAIGDFFSNLIDTIKQKLLGLLPSWAQRALGGSLTSEVQQQQQNTIPVTESGIIRGGDVPMMAEGGIVQSPIQAVVGEAGPEAIIPLDQLSNIIASTTGGQGGGRPSWVDEVVSAIRENKDVYMDRIKVSSTVTDTQERSGRQNRFGLQGA